MKKQKKSERVACAVATSGPAAQATAAAAQERVTLANLQTAYGGERNARARYLAFAQEADEEGYAPVASLFRAAAQAEKIHANNHRQVILSLGGIPRDEVDTPVVKSTRDNLHAAIIGEVYERDEMYPTFVHKARAEGNRSAARTFHVAQRVEAEHAALFTHALENLERMRGDAVTYYVCPVCGFTTLHNAPCPVCSTGPEGLLTVR